MDIGVIAESMSDVDVMREITAKIVPRNSFAFKHFVGNGCGKLRAKCGAWAMNLLERGCEALVVVHDLDDNDEHDLRRDLEGKVRDVKCAHKIVMIPVREIEAWLLKDGRALQRAFRLRRKCRIPADPETVRDAKGRLRDVVWQAGRIRYINTIHNLKIAAQASISALQNCRSFNAYPRFVQDAMGNCE